MINAWTHHIGKETQQKMVQLWTAEGTAFRQNEDQNVPITAGH